MNTEVSYIFDENNVELMTALTRRHIGKKAVGGYVARFMLIIAATLCFLPVAYMESRGAFCFVLLLGFVEAVCLLIYHNYTFPKALRQNYRQLLGTQMTVVFYGDYFYSKLETPLEINESSFRYESVKSVIETKNWVVFECPRSKVVCVPKALLSPEALNDLMLFVNSRLYSVKKTDFNMQ